MDSSKKIVDREALKRKIRRLSREGKKIVFTNGCFDILHVGHIKYLEWAKKKDRILVVGLNSDSSVRKIKGPGRPINPQKNRAIVLAALGCVDFITVFNEETPYKLIQVVEPDLLIKGSDWKGKGVVGSDIVKGRGGKVELFPYVPRMSTTNILKVAKRRGKSSK